MATTTPNLGLTKPESSDKLVDSLYDFNGNADLLDALIGKLSDLNTAQKDSLVAAINEALTSAGTAAGFGDPVATVDGNTGTPSVEVTASGPDTAKVFTFTFKNLKGEKGADGKSAYQYAQDSGYTGTEAEFAEKLASELLIVKITDSNGTLSADKTYIDILRTITAGIPVLVNYGGTDLPPIALSADALYFGAIMCDETSVGTNIIEITPYGEVNDISAFVETLPNPNAITFTGAVTGSYDGSAPMTVNIPSAVTDDHINSLIDTKLGVIENGAY